MHHIATLSLQRTSSTREGLEEGRIVLGNRRAVEGRNDWVQSTGQLCYRLQDVANQSTKDVRRALKGSLEREAHEVVSLEKGVRPEDVAGKVVDVDTNEAVGLSCVSSESVQFRVGRFEKNGFAGKGSNAVFITDDTAVPLRQELA